MSTNFKKLIQIPADAKEHNVPQIAHSNEVHEILEAGAEKARGRLKDFMPELRKKLGF